LVCTTGTADASIASGDFYFPHLHRIEGFNIADLGWGTANAQSVTLSFWVRSNVTGTYPAAIRNSDATRSYVATFTVNAANTYEYKTVTIPGDTSGTWVTNNGTGMQLSIGAIAGTAAQTTANAWAAGNFYTTSACTNWMATTANTFFLSGVQLEKGSTATPFEFRSIGQELALCRRYARPFGDSALGIWLDTSGARVKADFDVLMRAAPTVVMTNTSPVFERWSVATYVGSGSSVVAAITNQENADFIINGFSSGQSYGAPAYSQNNFAFLSAEL